MRQSRIFAKTAREVSAEEVSVNAKLLTRASYIDKLMAGTYSFLPLGLRVFTKIAQVIREELNAIEAQELLLPALHPKEPWELTGRWQNPGREVMFQLQGRGDRAYGLGWTHEEIITPLVKKFVSSYKDLPVALYQIQTKFRDEPRAKSGLLRGREFIMKDLYSFHANEADLERYYAIVLKAYTRIFSRVGLEAHIVEAAGGAFSKYSHEFQVITPAGEDSIIICEKGDYQQNREISTLQAGDQCPKCGNKVRAERAIEVGNIFKLKTRFSEVFNLNYRDEHGKECPVFMGCYGIGLGRVMGAIAEVHHDARGLCWPAMVAPFRVHLIGLQDSVAVQQFAQKVYASLQKSKVEVLYDDRAGLSVGEKLADADLIGIPFRAVVSEKTIVQDSIELKRRNENEIKIVTLKGLLEQLASA